MASKRYEEIFCKTAKVNLSFCFIQTSETRSLRAGSNGQIEKAELLKTRANKILLPHIIWKC